MSCLGLFLLFGITLPILFLLLVTNIITITFAKLGIGAIPAFILLILVIFGSVVNIPIYRRVISGTAEQPPASRLFYYTPTHTGYQTIALNVGGAVIPIAFSLYLFTLAPVLPTLATMAIVAAAAKYYSKPSVFGSVSLPLLITPFVSLICALILSFNDPAPVTFIGGVLGTLIGAYLLNLKRLRATSAFTVSIGGAGVFGSIFLIAIVSFLIS